MKFCKHRVMDRCRKKGRPCTFSKECFEAEEDRETNADRIRAMSDEELAERRKAEEARGKKAFTPPMRQREVSKALRAYGKMVSSADKGGVRIVED